ncbi:unnamed protein product [Brassica oleracea]|uniref:(rape) hypothetical protein n=1 Tax=Brassica napus TaxID=3708 RepID=A0A816KLS6_BRANA|nr:unnamed protein product [Brassica napus]
MALEGMYSLPALVWGKLREIRQEFASLSSQNSRVKSSSSSSSSDNAQPLYHLTRDSGDFPQRSYLGDFNLVFVPWRQNPARGLRSRAGDGFIVVW